VTARLWADDPYVSTLEWAQVTRSIGTPSQIVAIVWMGLSALVDGVITLILVVRLRPHRATSPRLVKGLLSLTFETVFLTHLCGATMCVIFLASDPKHRTNKDVFWVLIETITELYALSMLFTINARRSLRQPDVTFGSSESGRIEEPNGGAGGFGVTEIERRVEGGECVSSLEFSGVDRRAGSDSECAKD
jgi:hypothetical protein